MYSIEHLNIITSSFCDLKCSYCFLHKNKFFRQYDKYILEKWKDGSYVQNIKKLFEILETDPNKVEDLSFWGGEPFLHIDVIAPQLKELFEFLPNIKSIVVPTNFVHTNAQALGELLKILDASITPRSEKDKLHFHLQMSIDGIEDDIFMKIGHEGSWERYKKNYDQLFDFLDKEYLPNIVVAIAISGTSRQDEILKRFANYENIDEHIKFWEKAKNYVIEKNKLAKNPEFMLNSAINFPTIAMPDKTDSIQGLDIVKMIKTINQVLYKNKAYYNNQDHLFREYQHCETDWPVCGKNHECPEASQRAITVLPDGTITQCPSGFIEHLPGYAAEILKTEDSLSYKKTLIAGHQFFNPLTASEKDMLDHQWYNIMGGFKDTYFAYINLGFAMAEELALSHQIDENYLLDPMLLLKHLQGAGTINECFRESINVTGLSYMAGHDLTRRWLNGYVAEAYNFHQAEIASTIQLSLELRSLEQTC